MIASSCGHPTGWQLVAIEPDYIIEPRHTQLSRGCPVKGICRLTTVMQLVDLDGMHCDALTKAHRSCHLRRSVRGSQEMHRPHSLEAAHAILLTDLKWCEKINKEPKPLAQPGPAEAPNTNVPRQLAAERHLMHPVNVPCLPYGDNYCTPSKPGHARCPPAG